MKIGNLKLLERDEHGLLYLAVYNDHYLELVNEWSQLFRASHLNWITFNFFQLEIDNSRRFADYLAFHLTLLGLGLHLHLSFTTSEQEKALDQMLEDIQLEAERVEWLEEALQELWDVASQNPAIPVDSQLRKKVTSLLELPNS